MSISIPGSLISYGVSLSQVMDSPDKQQCQRRRQLSDHRRAKL